MAWQFVGVSAVAETTTTTLTLTMAPGVANGDLLVACIALRTTSTTSITNTGWTLVAEQKTNNTLTTSSAVASAVMFYQIRAGASDVSFTMPSGISVAMGRIVAYRNVNQVSPTDTQTSFTTAVNTTAVSGAGLTTTQIGDLIVAMAAGGQEAAWSAFDAATDPTTASGATDTSTAPTAGTWIERADSLTTSGADTSLAIFDAIRTTAGATGNLTATASVAAAHVVIAGAFRITHVVSAEAGGYTCSGTDASLEHGWELVPEAASYSYSGTNAALLHAPFLIGYVFTGSDATLTHEAAELALSAESGSYSFAGQEVTGDRTWRLIVEAASYSFAGQEVTLDRTYRLIVEAASYSFAGSDATLTYVAGELVLSAEAGSYAVSGTAASLERGYVLVAETFISAGGSPIGLLLTLTGGGGSTYAFSGSPADLTVVGELVLDVDAGSYAVSGTAATLTWTAGLVGFVFTGSDATLTYEEVTETVLAAAGGSFAFSGTTASLEHGWELVPDAGSYSFSGTDAALALAGEVILIADTGAYAFSGSDAALTYVPTAPIAPATTWGGEGAEFWVRKWRKQAQALKPVVVKPFAEVVNEQAPAQHVVPAKDDRRPDPEFTEFTDFIRLLEKL